MAAPLSRQGSRSRPDSLSRSINHPNSPLRQVFSLGISNPDDDALMLSAEGDNEEDVEDVDGVADGGDGNDDGDDDGDDENEDQDEKIGDSSEAEAIRNDDDLSYDEEDNHIDAPLISRGRFAEPAPLNFHPPATVASYNIPTLS